ncbi:hypothetical protein B5M09_010286 [Aphanomyces astaci]|uniref:Centromere protein J C-terminal domain-containing protein n=1 Tax=Aphanomyces astaci TaxID=112090 RepID=A0A3R7WLI9_APHAT|nr:hypothetical protein B5M09_010286 [Aphanomyces astaci]
MKKDKSTTVDEDAAYNPAQYQPNYGAVGQSKDKSDSRRTNGSETHHSDDGDQHKNDLNGAFGLETTISDDGHETPDDQATPSLSVRAASQLKRGRGDPPQRRQSRAAVETHHANGAKEISFVDGTTKRIETNGDEWSTFPDGTRMVEAKSGFREVINPDGSRARDYPDGRTTWITPQGVEQPVQYKRPTA